MPAARGLGPGLALQRRPHGPRRPSPDRAPRARPERARHRGSDRPDHRPGAQVPGLVHLAGAGRARYRAWDLRGKRAGKSVCALLGGVPRAAARLRLQHAPRHHARGRGRAPRRPARAVRLRRLQVPRRQRMRPRRDEWPGRTERVVPTVREALGDDAALLVDANSCYSPARRSRSAACSRTARRLHFEEPCPYWELALDRR